ncbi:hypothetical protein [Croceibacterium aestuarii]|uniref:hypothetical protein n=1 Tax=Croceibacterium aestuarii TaxID=3064139 RepID=UPI00272E5B70|nr:hypothetical protein [Croceibacterium sp. D39]
MPDQQIRKIMTANDPADVAQMALIECVRQVADNGKQTNKLLEGMQAELRDVRERVIRIEATEFKTELGQAKREIDRLRTEAKGERDALAVRVTALESKENQRAGVRIAFDAIVKYGPVLVVVLAGAFIVMVATGRLTL